MERALVLKMNKSSINQSIKVICNARNVVHKLESEKSRVAKAPLVTMGRPKFTPFPSQLLPLRRSPPPSNTPIPRPTPLITSNGIRIQSAVLPQYTLRTDRPTGECSVTWAAYAC